MDNRPIGIFDSGLGGLTVLKEIRALMPKESLVYFGDSGRAPYGTKSRETVIKYTLQDVRFLLKHDIKMIVVACNTASALSLEKIKENVDVPVVEVIKPGALTGVKSTRNKKIGVIGTPATINSRAYEKEIKRLDESIQVFSKACPLFVPLVEEGPEWWENEVAYKIALEYLSSLRNEKIDTLVLGCTHYPLLQKVISSVMGDGVNLVSSAYEAAKAVKKILDKNEMNSDEKNKPIYKYYTSDSVEKFKPFCSAILNDEIISVEKIDIEKY
ncbi:MAG TPA: glutamate racemase [Clostridiaceae bacterium]|nr:glutamate racemase [Clostridiaceae bacterium]